MRRSGRHQRGMAGSGLAGAAAVFAVAAFFSPTPAQADFRLCNSTDSRVGVAVGYRNGEAWVTEGWWNIPAKSCETVMRGPLAARYYYVHALDYDHGGNWSGSAFMCTRDQEFTIRGMDNCLARGYNRTGFFEIDTASQRTWTVQLTDTQTQTASPDTSALGRSFSALSGQ